MVRGFRRYNRRYRAVVLPKLSILYVRTWLLKILSLRMVPRRVSPRNLPPKKRTSVKKMGNKIRRPLVPLHYSQAMAHLKHIEGSCSVPNGGLDLFIRLKLPQKKLLL